MAPARLSGFAVALTISAMGVGCGPAVAQTTAYDQCDAHSAEPATVDAIKGDHDRWRGRCISVEGVFGHNRLFADEAAFAAFEHSGAGPEARSLAMQYYEPRHRAQFMQALAFTEDQEEAGEFVRVRMIGLAGYCADEHAAIARLQAESPNAIILSAGQCHYTSGAKLNPVSMEALAG